VNPTGTLADVQIKDMKEAVEGLSKRLQVANVSSESEIDAAFAALRQSKVGALVIGTDPIFTLYRGQIIALAARYKISAIYNIREYCEVGGLMSYGASLTDTLRQAAIYVSRVLKGEKPANLPVLQPTKFELVINLKTAKALGITVPDTLLTRADEVIALFPRPGVALWSQRVLVSSCEPRREATEPSTCARIGGCLAHALLSVKLSRHGCRPQTKARTVTSESLPTTA
jgi:hypothetical protein